MSTKRFRSLRFSLREIGSQIIPLSIWVLILAAVEFAGRFSPNDFGDAILATLLFSTTLTIHAARSLTPILAAVRAVNRATLWIRSPQIRIGADFRHQPELPRSYPRSMLLTVGSLAIANIFASFAMSALPGGLRSFLQPHCFLIYLFLISMLWAGLILLGTFLVAITWMTIRDLFILSFNGQGTRSRRGERMAIWGIAISVLVAACILPMHLPLFFAIGVAIAVSVLFMFASPGLELLWRSSAGDQVKSMDGRRYLWLAFLSVSLITLLMIQLSSGSLVINGGSASELQFMPLTSIISQLFAWCSVPGMAMVLLHVWRFAWLGIQFNPQREWKRRQAQGMVGNRQWEIENRRELVKGLRKLFKRKARLDGPRGTGVWIGIQHWFVLGLSRDTEDFDAETTTLDHIIGQPYWKLFSTQCRFHYWEICRALQVDLILVEDGVSFRRFVRALRVMFEVFDMHAGREQVEERHFIGLPGVHVAIHLFELNQSESLGRTGYPEPDYDEIGRARILHIFKDRGGDMESFDPIPWEFDDVPVLSGM